MAKINKNGFPTHLIVKTIAINDPQKRWTYWIQKTDNIHELTNSWVLVSKTNELVFSNAEGTECHIVKKIDEGNYNSLILHCHLHKDDKKERVRVLDTAFKNAKNIVYKREEWTS